MMYAESLHDQVASDFQIRLCRNISLLPVTTISELEDGKKKKEIAFIHRLLKVKVISHQYPVISVSQLAVLTN